MRLIAILVIAIGLWGQNNNPKTQLFWSQDQLFQSEGSDDFQIIMSCDGIDPSHIHEAMTHPHGCHLVGSHTLDELMTVQIKEKEDLERCGHYGDWILDQNGNVMYRRLNPPCPKQPKPKDYGNYTEHDLTDIGIEVLESARPRVLTDDKANKMIDALCVKPEGCKHIHAGKR